MINKDKLLEAIAKREYGFYYDDRTPKFSRPEVNCSDEPYPGSHERMDKINELKTRRVQVGDPDFMQKWGNILSEMHTVVQEEVKAMLNCNEQQARLWMDKHIDFNHVKTSEDEYGNQYLSIDPVLVFEVK